MAIFAPICTAIEFCMVITKDTAMTRYQHLANLLAERIEQGLYRSGERLPSVRALSQEHGVSISTVQQAYQILENLQLITPQPRSGYFVAHRKAQPPVPAMSRPVQRPVEVTHWDEILTLMEGRTKTGITAFGGGQLRRATGAPGTARADRTADAGCRIGRDRRRSDHHQRMP